MRRARLRGMLLCSFVLLSFAAVIPSASAQVPPIPPLPQPSIPPQGQPVLEILAPTIYPQCGTATLVVFLIGSSESAIAPQLYSATAPLFAVCGQVPRPGTQLTCIFDAQAQQLVNGAGGQAGASLPLGLHPEGDAVEQTIVVEDKLPPPANSVGAGRTAALFLGCAPITYTRPSRGDYSSAPSYEPPPSSYTYPPPALPGSIPGSFSNPGAPVPPVLSSNPPPATPVGDAIRYAGIWLLPLALLLFGGYFGGALTRDIDVPSPA
jgi:hypothetical protein